MSRRQTIVLPVFLCLLFVTLVSGARAGESDCSLRLGGIGSICRVPGRYPTIEIWGAQPHERAGYLLRVNQAQVDAVAPGNLVAGSADGRVAVRVGPERHVTISMGPDPEGKVHHVTLEYILSGRVIGMAVSYDGPPAAPARAGTGAGRGLVVYRQPPQEDGSIIHVVRPGEFLGAIARAWGIRQQEIIDLNDLGDRNLLYVGQELLIQPAPPALPENCQGWEPVVHVVRRGETITRIARRLGIHPESLAIRNGLPHKGRLLHVGHRLVIPDTWVRDGEPASLPADCAPVGLLIHVVRPGHTLNAIALAYGVEASAIIERNRLKEGGRWLWPGQRLVIRDAPEAG